MAWALQTDQKHFMTLPGRILAMLVSRIEFSGTRPWLRSIRFTTSVESGFTAAPLEGKIYLGGCCFFRSFTRQQFHTQVVTTIEWIRFGGMNNGWDGPLAHSIQHHRMLITLTGYKEIFC